MDSERLVVVGLAWTLVLIGLLVLREYVRAADASSWRSLVPFINMLAVVMLCAVGLAAVLQLATIVGSTTAGTSGRSAGLDTSLPGATPTVAASSPSPTAPLSPTASPTPQPVTPSSSPTASPSPTVSLTPQTATPSPTPPPTASPTPPPTASPTPSPLATPTAVPRGRVSAGPRFRAFEVAGARVTGFRTVQVAQRFTAESSAPATYAFPSFSDPAGTIDLVRVESGDLAGIYLSPEDPGVAYQPGG